MLQSLVYAKQMLVTQGTESFKECFSRLFTLEKKDPKKRREKKRKGKGEDGRAGVVEGVRLSV